MGLANEARLHAFSSSTPPSHTRSADASAPAGRNKAHQAEESTRQLNQLFTLARERYFKIKDQLNQ